MPRLFFYLIRLLPLLYSSIAFSQAPGLLHSRYIRLGPDTIVLDSLSIQPGTLRSAAKIDSFYHILPFQGILVKKEGVSPEPDSVFVSYRVYPFNFSREVKNKSRQIAGPEERGVFNPFVYTPQRRNDMDLKFDGLNKTGSISRGITMGNSQDLAVNSTLNLQLSGKLTPDIDISAAITDDNIPIQPEGNTQQLQDFDRVYIQLSNKTSRLIVGDFQVSRPESYFMNFNKRLQGAGFNTVLDRKAGEKPLKIKAGASAAVARGRFHRNNIQATEGNQGPYRLKGANNEQYIVILSGSEKVYIDGRLLRRGQENDYIIDYNSAEITFTSRNLMTKDKRIFVEFEYSDKNYARSLLHLNNEYELSKLKLRFNIYSEQDSRNQPLQQQLDADQKQTLRLAGDSLQLATVPAVDSVAYTTELILYELRDTLVEGILYKILVYSVDPAKAIYKAAFTNVGAGRGSYVQESSAANGRVFRWVAPRDGVPQGTFEPRIQLIPPTQRQLITLGSDYKLSNTLILNSELAWSRFDQNTFSPLDSDDDAGYAARFSISDTRKFGPDSLPWTLVSTVSYEQVHKNFSPIERFRNVEFERDWNISGLSLQSGTEYIPRASFAISRARIGNLNYLYSSYIRGNQLNSSQHLINTNIQVKGSQLKYAGSVTGSNANSVDAIFYRHKALLSQRVKVIALGYSDEFERNLFKNPLADTLIARSYQFFDRQVFVRNSDTSRQKVSVFYRIRTDEGVMDNRLKQYAWAENFGFSLDMASRENFQLKLISSYRRLLIKDTILTKQAPENTLVNRVELGWRLFKSAISSTTFYEAGSGLESRKEFTYLEVQPGQGVYQWTDYNGNGIKELDEFEIAAFPDQARFIRIFTPTQDFIRVFSGQFNQILNIKAPVAWTKKEGMAKLMSKFSNQLAFRVESRTGNQNPLVAYIPFSGNIEDPELITLNRSFRNSLFFNKTNPKFGMDITWQQLGSKALLNNGLESREHNFGNYRIRWNPGTRFSMNAETRNGIKSSNASFFAARNYRISFIEAEPKLTYQPGPSFRITFSYKQSRKRNQEEAGGERASSHSSGAEIKYNVPDRGSLTARLNFILISYTGLQNTPVAFEMQDGLRSGNNYTWGINYQRTLSNNMQINFNYDGRKSPDVAVVHVGGVQVRVFF